MSISLEEALQAKNKIFNSQLLKNVLHVREVVQNLVIVQTDVLTVVEMEELEQIKVFLQFNKLVLNVLEVEKITNPCNDCNGQGNRQLQKVSVTIPKGVDDGTRIRLAGKGEAGTRGGASGDLYLFINVDSHQLFKRSDVNLFFEFPISLADAALGTTMRYQLLMEEKQK